MNQHSITNHNQQISYYRSKISRLIAILNELKKLDDNFVSSQSDIQRLIVALESDIRSLFDAMFSDIEFESVPLQSPELIARVETMTIQIHRSEENNSSNSSQSENSESDTESDTESSSDSNDYDSESYSDLSEDSFTKSSQSD